MASQARAVAMPLFLLCNHTPDFDGFSILATNNNKIKVSFMENTLINKDYALSN